MGTGDGFVSVSDGVSNTETLNFNNCIGLSANLPGNYGTYSVGIFPDSEKVFIEITETEGTFYIQSVELFLIE
ncbi:hypothetical protein [Bacillus cereus]|uniref:hypothetical protein n=1 Tax=Bacillus cereus TaxID=1396 RepID=UPI0005CE419F|nr:hypothetical protein [Bacillus cereus]